MALLYTEFWLVNVLSIFSPYPDRVPDVVFAVGKLKDFYIGKKRLLIEFFL